MVVVIDGALPVVSIEKPAKHKQAPNEKLLLMGRATLPAAVAAETASGDTMALQWSVTPPTIDLNVATSTGVGSKRACS